MIDTLQLEQTRRHLHEANLDREALYEQTKKVPEHASIAFVLHFAPLQKFAEELMFVVHFFSLYVSPGAIL